MRPLLIAGAIVLAALSQQALATWLLVPAAREVRLSGKPGASDKRPTTLLVPFELIFLNTTGEDRTIELPVCLAVRKQLAGQVTAATVGKATDKACEVGTGVRRETNAFSVRAGAFLKESYFLHLESEAEGGLVVQIAEVLPMQQTHAVREVDHGIVVGDTATTVVARREGVFFRDSVVEPVSVDRAARLSAPVIDNEPMYFLVGGGKDLTSKFQLSVKYPLWQGPRQSVNVAYTQLSIWDLASESKPFRDNNYRPGAFYEHQFQMPTGSPHGLSLRAGFEHESNGRNGRDSRSLNILFARPTWRYDMDGGRFVELRPRFFVYQDKAENPDIQRYRGYADWYGRIGDRVFGQDVQLGLMVRRGTANFGSAQLDLTWRLPGTSRRQADEGVFFTVQYFNGYGETLLDYNRRTAQLRAGLSIVR